VRSISVIVSIILLLSRDMSKHYYYHFVERCCGPIGPIVVTEPIAYCLSKTSFRVHHTLNKQLYGRQFFSLPRDLRYGTIRSNRMLTIVGSNFLWWCRDLCRCLTETNAKRCFSHCVVVKLWTGFKNSLAIFCDDDGSSVVVSWPAVAPPPLLFPFLLTYIYIYIYIYIYGYTASWN
jgi:hypothetical protein